MTLRTPLVLALAGLASLAAAQSTDRNHPTPVTQKAFRHSGEGEKVQHFYGFTAGPGTITVTMGMGAKAAASNVDFELFDAGGAKLLYNYMNATTRAEQATKQLILRKRQSLLLSVTPDANAAYYSVALDGAVEIGEPAEETPAAEVVAPVVPRRGLELDLLELAGERRALPTTGLLVVETKDGVTQQFDLATVQRVTIRK